MNWSFVLIALGLAFFAGANLSVRRNVTVILLGFAVVLFVIAAVIQFVPAAR